VILKERVGGQARVITDEDRVLTRRLNRNQITQKGGLRSVVCDGQDIEYVHSF